MASLKYSANTNLQTVNLGAGYTAASGTMTLTAGHGARLPASGDFWIRQASATSSTLNILKVTARTTDTLTVVGGQDGTTDQNIANGSEMLWTLSVSAFDQFRQDISGAGLISALPASPKAGDIYRPSNALVEYRYNGSSWDTYGPIYKLAPILASAVTVISGTAVDANGGLLISGVISLATIPTPANPWTAIVGFCGSSAGTIFDGWQLGVMDGSTQQRVDYGFSVDPVNTMVVRGQRINSSGVYVSDDYKGNGSALYSINSLTWIKIVMDGTNRLISYGGNPYVFVQRYSDTKNNYVTPGRISFSASNGFVASFTLTQP